MSSQIRSNLQKGLGIDEDLINRIIFRSPYSYKVYEIKKRNGGSRTIAQPALETKFLQYWLIENVFQDLPIHDCATAYKSGSGIKDNVEPHRKNSYLTKFDFSDFFSSIKANNLEKHLKEHIGERYQEQDIADIVRISCIKFSERKELCLSIGAPSSPLLSNTILYGFDCAIFEWCVQRGITYTRYADDLTFSTNEKGVCDQIEPAIRKITADPKHRFLTLNERKTIHVSKKFQRKVTGIIINNREELSIGRSRKREISALIHRFSLEQLSLSEIYYLQGLLGFAKDIEPLFLNRMSQKYGGAIIETILKIRKESD